MISGSCVCGENPPGSGTDINFSASVKRVGGDHGNQCPDASVQQIDPETLAETQPDTAMANSMTTYSDRTLQKIALFFDHYKPSLMDREWAEERKAEVQAEIERRKQEDKESNQ